MRVQASLEYRSRGGGVRGQRASVGPSYKGPAARSVECTCFLTPLTGGVTVTSSFNGNFYIT